MDERGYQTIPALMLKDTDYAPLLHGPNDVFFIGDALDMMDALEEVVMVWKEGMDAFALQSQEECASTALGTIAVARLAMKDLRGPLPEVPRDEADEILKSLSTAFMPLARSYARTPMLAKWYVSLPLRVAETYNRLRGTR
jgi:hypothetical protein